MAIFEVAMKGTPMKGKREKFNPRRKSKTVALSTLRGTDLLDMCCEASDSREARNGFTEAMEIVNFTLPKAFAKDGGPTIDEARTRIVDEIYAPQLEDTEFTEPLFETLKREIFKQGCCIDVTQEAVAYCVFAVRAFFEGNEALSWSYASDASYWAGIVMMVAKQRALPEPAVIKNMLANLRSAQARTAALAKLDKDPKQAAKAEAFKLWQDWHSGKTIHKSGAAFARYVVDVVPAIESTKTVERWVTQWRNQAQEIGTELAAYPLS